MINDYEVYFFNQLKEWWREKRAENQKNEELTSEQERLEIDQDYSNKLDEDLERVYFELFKANAANRRRNNNETSV